MRSLKSFPNIIAISKLGTSTNDKLRLIFYFIELIILRKIKVSNLSQPRSLKIMYGSRTFTFLVTCIDDYKLLEEMFIEKQYSLNTDTPIKTIVDLGSNVGTSIVYFKETYPEARIYGFEPVNSCFSKLSKTVGDYPLVVIKKLAIHHQDNITIPIHISKSGNLGSSIIKSEDGETELVQTINLDSIINDLKSIDILKIDIEGLEYEIFKNLKGLAKIKYILVEVHFHNTGKTVDDFVALCPGFKLLENNKNPYTSKVATLKLANTNLL